MSAEIDLSEIDHCIDWEAIRLKYSEDRPCRICGKPLQSIYTHRTTCSNACRQRLYRLRKEVKQQLAGFDHDDLFPARPI